MKSQFLKQLFDLNLVFNKMASLKCCFGEKYVLAIAIESLRVERDDIIKKKEVVVKQDVKRKSYLKPKFQFHFN